MRIGKCFRFPRHQIRILLPALLHEHRIEDNVLRIRNFIVDHPDIRIHSAPFQIVHKDLHGTLVESKLGSLQDIFIFRYDAVVQYGNDIPHQGLRKNPSGNRFGFEQRRNQNIRVQYSIVSHRSTAIRSALDASISALISSRVSSDTPLRCDDSPIASMAR